MDRAGREALTAARQALLMRHDIIEPVLPQSAADGDDVVVCLHGLLSTAGVLRPLRARLERHPHVHTGSLTYPPGAGIEALSQRLEAFLGELPARVRIHLLGHSLGGVVVRHYAQEVGDPRVVQTISLAAPFAGVPHSARLGAQLARDLDSSGPLLRHLLLGSQSSAAVPHLSLIAEQDGVLSAPTAHALPGGGIDVIRGCGHNGMLLHPAAIAAVERRVLDRSARPRHLGS